ncbi:MAG: hypothetical protein ACYCO5_00465 [Acidobacteriaceae bacterium]
MSQHLPQHHHSKGVSNHQPPQKLRGDLGFALTQSGGWIHRDTLIALTEAICAILFIGHSHDQAIRWTIALNAFLLVYCDVAPRFYRHPLFHFFSGILAAYTSLCTVVLWQQHLLGKVF